MALLFPRMYRKDRIITQVPAVPSTLHFPKWKRGMECKWWGVIIYEVTVSVCRPFALCLPFLMAKKSQTNTATFLAENNLTKVHGDAKAALSEKALTWWSGDWLNKQRWCYLGRFQLAGPCLCHKASLHTQESVQILQWVNRGVFLLVLLRPIRA